MKDYLRLILILLLMPFLVLSKSNNINSQNKCKQKRAAFDIGSGSTKLVVAEIDICIRKIIKIYTNGEKQIKLPFKKDLDKSKNGKFSKKMMDEGLKGLKQLKLYAEKNFGVTNFSAVATDAFRKALNGTDYTHSLSTELNFNIHIITQTSEAVLGFLAASGKLDIGMDKILVWDIGGGSMQMTALNSHNDDNDTEMDKQYVVYKGKLASISFKNIVLESIQGKTQNAKNSPNPLGKEVSDKSVKLAQMYSALHVPEVIKEKARNLKIIGIGGVHFHSIRNQIDLKGEVYTSNQLRETLNKKITYNDKQVGGDYAQTDITNLALILGFMQELGITVITSLNVNMAHGILLYQGYWE
jgi:exopolyphosphatase/guanosine-5'-triphosphate,3'-diphosphate pyrophosphatase